MPVIAEDKTERVTPLLRFYIHGAPHRRIHQAMPEAISPCTLGCRPRGADTGAASKQCRAVGDLHQSDESRPRQFADGAVSGTRRQVRPGPDASRRRPADRVRQECGPHVSIAQPDRAFASEARDRCSSHRGNSNHGTLCGAAPVTVLKTADSASCGDRHVSVPPIGKTNRSGTGAGWKPRGTRKGVGIVRSVFRQYGKSTGQEFGTRSKRAGTAKVWGSRPRLSANSRNHGCTDAPPVSLKH